VTIEVRTANDADKAGILDVLKEVFDAKHAARIERLWEWQWHDNPGLREPGYRGAVAVHEDRIIGTIGFMPANLQVDGNPVAAVWAVDAAVHFPWLRRAVEGRRVKKRKGDTGVAAELLDLAGNIAVLGKHVSPAMQVIIRKIGFAPVPQSGYFGRRLGFTARIGRALGSPLAAGVARLPSTVLARIGHPPPEVQVHQGTCDARFDALWTSWRDSSGGIGQRDAAVLNWRYHCHPISKYTFITHVEGTELHGYVVVTVSPKGKGRIVDLLVRYGDEHIVTGLLQGALKELRSSGADRVDCYVANSSWQRHLQSLGMQRTARDVPVLVRGLDPAMSLYITTGDADGG